VAQEQDSGKGRLGRRWFSPPGGLYVSILLPADPLLPLRVGIALVSALEELGVSSVLKWPNDVLVREKKVAGILIDGVADTAIAGIGVNLAPVAVPGATSLSEETARAIGRDDLLDRILGSLFREPQESLPKRYAHLCATVGRNVRVETGESGPNRTLVGRACGVDSSGRLLVEAGGRLHAICAGDCTHLHETAVA
jgi:BirA family biotin operon repressor/biotin-[acetyl-CoA-carboxylase] ligase